MMPDMPVTLKPGPETLTFEIVALEVPELVRVALREPVLPVSMLPKFKLDGLTVNWVEALTTVSIAALLVALPAVLLTITVNCAPLLALVVAGVV